ncbi:hypothetical protein EV363DRAFT_1309663 [Boletus edulis]|uniref:Uncharacterized protein n=1 Tax=Boletus edulis BED1 TaxID=1328754 RepID=A0AAD4GLN1_BOLED|nr:hypothetical protein EV363DRAFT_1309663 [Boletus edulis]KAF8437093.1 hypothetical protein L210DRAFT_3546864 [Boletus edulis BED1]KAF8449475.1 hypothetical protein L210DRAFT_3524926 [Boletus edulis BED1]
MQANARVIKHYRSKNTKTITETIQSAFDDYFRRDLEQPRMDIPGPHSYRERCRSLLTCHVRHTYPAKA